LTGGICVRNAQPGEKITLLDGSELECREDTLVIADQKNALAVAGIMGGLNSSVQSNTRDIFLEAAFFTPSLIAGKARSYGLHTDSSHRFERGVDPELQVQAIHRATDLLLQITGGTPGPLIERSSHADLPVAPAITLRHHRIERLLGIPVSTQQVEQILSRLNMKFTSRTDSWLVTAPAYRFDINIEADLIEEVGRIIGYNNIPGSKEAAHITMAGFSEKVVPLNKLKDALVLRGYHEAITYSFVSPELQQILHPEQATLKLSNPISSDMSEMRTRLLPGLIQALSYNLNRQQSSIKLFETGLCFIPEDSGLTQCNHIAGVITGLPHSENWLDKKRVLDFYDIKGDLQTLMHFSSQKAFEFKPTSEPVLHPGQAADIYYQDKKVGFTGALHPSVLRKTGIEQKVFVFEVETESLLTSAIPSFSELSKYPSIRRDLALIVDQHVSYQQLIDAIDSLKNEIIQEAFVFDVYTGKEVIINRKSVALGLILQGFSRTLTDKDVDQCVARVLQILEKEYNAVLR
jgi:phenylalanyl-tRNA synthetase beta chain